MGNMCISRCCWTVAPISPTQHGQQEGRKEAALPTPGGLSLHDNKVKDYRTSLLVLSSLLQESLHLTGVLCRPEGSDLIHPPFN